MLLEKSTSLLYAVGHDLNSCERLLGELRVKAMIKNESSALPSCTADFLRCPAAQATPPPGAPLAAQREMPRTPAERQPRRVPGSEKNYVETRILRLAGRFSANYTCVMVLSRQVMLELSA